MFAGTKKSALGTVPAIVSKKRWCAEHQILRLRLRMTPRAHSAFLTAGASWPQGRRASRRPRACWRGSSLSVSLRAMTVRVAIRALSAARVVTRLDSDPWREAAMRRAAEKAINLECVLGSSWTGGVEANPLRVACATQIPARRPVNARRRMPRRPVCTPIGCGTTRVDHTVTTRSPHDRELMGKRDRLDSLFT